jgi:hypothetical protein
MKPFTQGDRVRLPCGQQAIVCDASGVDKGVMVVMPIDPTWPFPRPSVTVVTEGVRRMPSRYRHESPGVIPHVEALL